MESWLKQGLTGRDPNTRTNREILARTHLIPGLGRRRLVDLTAEEVDAWLAGKTSTLSTETLSKLLGVLRAVIRRAQARDFVKRNVALLCDPPKGRLGRPSKSLNVDEAGRLVDAAFSDSTVMRPYVVVSLLTGARTEELRALTWSHVDLDGDLPTLSLWRSVRATGDSKTRKSRRTLEMPTLCVEVLQTHRVAQLETRIAAGERWAGLGLVFCTSVGSPLDAANVRRAFRRVARVAGLDANAWTPRELRHSLVSLLSSTGLGIEASRTWSGTPTPG